MEKPKLNSSDQALVDRLGLEPEMVENLLESQEAYKAKGVNWNLEEVYAFEVETP